MGGTSKLKFSPSFAPVMATTYSAACCGETSYDPDDFVDCPGEIEINGKTLPCPSYICTGCDDCGNHNG